MRIAGLLSLILIAASGGQYSHAAVRDAYKSEAGPFAVSVTRATLPVSDQAKDLQMRVACPTEGGPFPVILFSHGGFSASEQYARILDHWASHGYVAIAPDHLDSSILGIDMRTLMAGGDRVTPSRYQDMSFILDSFDALEAAVPLLSGKLDRRQLVIAGHSRGSSTASFLAGVVTRHPLTGETRQSSEHRFDAVLFLSEVGNVVFLPNQAWRAIVDLPTFTSTGTNDYGRVARLSMGMQSRVVPRGPTNPDNKHLLFTRDMDHHLGGLIGGGDETGHGPDHEAFAIVAGCTTAFLDAYLKRDAVALEFISGDIIETLSGGRSTMGK